LLNHTSSEDLHRAESEVWGRAATEERGRSDVDVRIEIEQVGGIDSSDIRQATPGAYALWPARAETTNNRPAAPRRMPGTRFRLVLVVPAQLEAEVRNVVRAWLLFGGYGGRTRRGLGSLKVLEDARAWLPSDVSRDAITASFGSDIFAAPHTAAGDTPHLGGAALHVDKASRDAVKAWTSALDWLKEFRQGTDGQPGDRAREPGAGKPEPQRPSISNWPEADNIRWLTGRTRAHPPRHKAGVTWPRAGFGLPIVGRFQPRARDGRSLDEPGSFELRWRAGAVQHDRLASPLIVKALPLADGAFVPCALWLNRAYPSPGEVGLARPRQGGRPTEREVDPSTVAPFDRLVAAEDAPYYFSALANKRSLRQAFLDWLHRRYHTTVIAP
jgi:CRISPR-associated protein Cmr1